MRIPVSTYRLQFNKDFTFRDAAHLIPYLHALGITDCYASPFLKAVPGSTHGYDVVDPTLLNPELGTDDDFQTYIDALQAHHMGQILDVVPNHMGIAFGHNPWWQDVLENGPSSHYADFFDIDWHPVKAELENKVLLPILGDQYGIVLENQEIALHYHEGEFFLRYYEHVLPLDPSPWFLILSFRLEQLIDQETPSNPHIQELQSIITALGNLPLRTERHPQRVVERYREKDVIKRRLAVLMQHSPLIATFLDDNLRILNGTKGDPRSFDLLDAILSDQAYRLAYWRVASEEINYRRFFDINELAAIRMEDPAVFQAVHARVFDLLRAGSVSGLRIDHVDGLYDPHDYLTQWQQWAQHELGGIPDAQGRSLFLVVEKILGKKETLCADWPVHGTSGYEFLSLINNMFVDSSHKRAFHDFYVRLVKDHMPWEELAYDCKTTIMVTAMSSAINSLGHQVNVLSEKNRRSRDFTLNSLIHAIREIIAGFPVYRTYVTPNPKDEVTDRDRAYIRLAVTTAKRRNPAMNTLVFDFIQDLLLKVLDDTAQLQWSEVHPFVMKFQQTTSPVTAKGIEDTAFYIYNPLISLNEVGNEPTQFGISSGAFHERMQERQQQWPYSLSPTSTHDSKRSEDIRARINVLSEIPREWKAALTRWTKLNKKKKRVIDDQPVPDRNEEYLLYQTLLGAWPLESMEGEAHTAFRIRIQGYMNKALREAKIHTSWINPYEAYEQAVSHFIETILDRTGPNPFLDDFLPFQQKISRFGMYNSLAQVTLKITAPGIPDFYQGTDLWDFSLVDPDNRRPVDYAQRRRILDQFPEASQEDSPGLIDELLHTWVDGRIKLYLTKTLLNFRKAHAELFLEGTYEPLEPVGEKSHHICGYQRQYKDQRFLTIVSRFFTKLCPDPLLPPLGRWTWGDTLVILPPAPHHGRYRDIVTESVVNVHHTHDGQAALHIEDLFQHLPFTILEHRP